MRYIITEKQSNVIRVLRRTIQDRELIYEIVDEGMEIFLCEFNTLNGFYEYICQNSAFTYLLNYFDNEHQEGFSEMQKYIIDFIKENFKEIIVNYWNDNRENC